MSKIAALFLIFSLLFCPNLQAADSKFSVEIKVDVTDENASLAREKAMSNAARAAVTAVARRISTQEGAARIAAMTDAQLINFIKETSVLNEKNSDVRYVADLRVVINEELLKQYMTEREIPLLSGNSGSILVIPVFAEFKGDTPKLWEIDNPWKLAWDNSENASATTFVSIPNSAGNSSVINAQKAIDFNTQALQTLKQMSASSDVYVLEANYDGVEGLEISLKSLSGDYRTIKVAGAKSSGEELFNKAVSECKNQIEHYILNQQQENPVVEQEITVLYPFPTLGAWISAEQKIKSIPAVNAVNVQAMAQGKAQFKVTFSGDLDTLTRQLAYHGYRLENSGNYMVMSNIGE